MPSIIFLAVCILWFLSELYLNRLRPDAKDQKGKDNNSLRVIWITLIISVAAGAALSFFIACPIMQSQSIRYAGISILVAGIIIRFYAVYTLGRMFTVSITIRQDHRIIKEGIYKYVRHPSYTGSLLSFLGLGLSLNNWISLAIIFIPVFIAFSRRMDIEEKMLADDMPDYKEYMRHTWRLLPWIY